MPELIDAHTHAYFCDVNWHKLTWRARLPRSARVRMLDSRSTAALQLCGTLEAATTAYRGPLRTALSKRLASSTRVR